MSSSLRATGWTEGLVWLIEVVVCCTVGWLCASLGSECSQHIQCTVVSLAHANELALYDIVKCFRWQVVQTVLWQVPRHLPIRTLACCALSVCLSVHLSVTVCLSVSESVCVSLLCVQEIVLLAALVCDGLGLIANTKAAVVRLGLAEMTAFSRLFYPGQDMHHIHCVWERSNPLYTFL